MSRQWQQHPDAIEWARMRREQDYAQLQNMRRRDAYGMAALPVNNPQPTCHCPHCGVALYSNHTWCAQAEINLKSWGHTIVDGVVY